MHIVSSRPARTRPTRLRRRPAARALEVRRVGQRHLEDVGAAGEILEAASEGVAEIRGGGGALLRWAVDEAAAAEVGVIGEGAFGAVRVSGAQGQGAVVVGEVRGF